MRITTAVALLATVGLLGTVACETDQDVRTDPSHDQVEPPAPPATGWEEPVERMETETPGDTIRGEGMRRDTL
jgi:hypothetical protein